MFKVFRIAKLTKLVRLTKFTKLTKLLIGAIGIHYAEKMPFGNSIWWSFVTVTTVGYGDISPSTTFGRIIASILMVTSAISYKDDIINDIKDKLDNIDTLSDDDIDTIATVLKSIRST